MAFSPNDMILAGGRADGTVWQWDVANSAIHSDGQLPGNPEPLDQADKPFTQVVQPLLLGHALTVGADTGAYWAYAHHVSSSSRSTTIGTVTVVVGDAAFRPRYRGR
jgi:hypothetical protein